MRQNHMQKQKWRIGGIFVLSFVLPVVIIALALNSIGICYNGERTLLTVDMRAQYAPYIAAVRYVLADFSSLLFNWNNSLGGNYMGVFAYYMGSPLNLITLFWSVEDIANAIYVLYLIKIGLAGLTFQIYLFCRHQEIEIPLESLVFSTCYALMSYIIFDGICIIWLDALILLPLVLLGVDRICEGKKGALFLGAMALMFFSNFYMSYMVGIFAFFYFCTKLLAQPGKWNWKKCLSFGLRFIGNTVFALGLVMPIMLPVLLATKYSQMGRNSKNVVQATAHTNILELLRQFLPGQYPAMPMFNEYGKPFLFCGSIFLILVPAFFFQKRKKREKIAFLLLGVTVLAGFLLPVVDFAWQGFRNPTGFPYRYAYLFSFWMTMVGYEAWLVIRQRVSKALVVFLALYTFGELYTNDSILLTEVNSEYIYEERFESDLYFDMYTPLMQEIKTDTGFYRRKDGNEYFQNVDIVYGTKGVYTFSSIYNNKVRMFLNFMGASRNSTGMIVTMNGCTPLLDSLMGVKYIVSSSNVMGLYNEKICQDVLNLYENEDALSLGYLIPQEAAENEPEFTEDVFYNQYLLMEYLGIPNSRVYHPLEYGYEVQTQEDGMDTIRIHFVKDSDKEVCCYLDGLALRGYEDQVVIYVDDELFAITTQQDTRRILILPSLSPGEEHIIQISGKSLVAKGFYLCEFDKEAYREEIAQFQDRQMEICSIKGKYIEGNMNAEREGWMFVTLPYDEGYTVYVDGEKVQTQAALETFLSFPVTAGKHDIEIVYFPVGLKAGIGVMIFFMFLMIVYYIPRKYQKR